MSNWSVVRLTGNQGADGMAVIAKYSPTGIGTPNDVGSDWHDKYDVNDVYMITTDDGGISWGNAIKIKGEDGLSAYSIFTNYSAITIATNQNLNPIANVDLEINFTVRKGATTLIYTDSEPAFGQFKVTTESGLESLGNGSFKFRLSPEDTISEEPLVFSINLEGSVTDNYSIPVSAARTGNTGSAGIDGKDGVNGTSITNVESFYTTSSSNTIPPNDSSFSETVQPPSSQNKYLWCYEKISYSSGSTTSTPKRVIGNYAKDGKEINKIEDYYLVSPKNSEITTSTKGWSTTIPTLTATDKYLWNYEKITFSDNTESTTSPVIIGVYGDQGIKGPSYLGPYQKAPTSGYTKGDWYLNISDGFCYYHNGSSWELISDYADYRCQIAINDMLKIASDSQNQGLIKAVNAWFENLTTNEAFVNSLFARQIILNENGKIESAGKDSKNNPNFVINADGSVVFRNIKILNNAVEDDTGVDGSFNKMVVKETSYIAGETSLDQISCKTSAVFEGILKLPNINPVDFYNNNSDKFTEQWDDSDFNGCIWVE